MAILIKSHPVNYNTYRWLSPLIFKLIEEVGAANIDILHNVVRDSFVIAFEVCGHNYQAEVNNTRLLPLDLNSSSIQELIVEIKLRHF